MPLSALEWVCGSNAQPSAAVSTGIGSQVQRPLATVVVGGMFLGPIILLIVVPAVQTLFLDRQRNTAEFLQGEERTS